MGSCSGNKTCVFDCDYQAAACTNSCPCFDGCPDGCDGCLTPFCKCYYYESNPNYVQCSDFYERLYSICILNCSAGDLLCMASCSRDLETNLEECPCRSQCPNGCPCPSYDCPEELTTTMSTPTTVSTTTTTTPAKPRNSILVLSTNGGYKAPVITDANGREHYNFFFRFGESTSVYYSCSMTFRNEFYVFGGFSGDDSRQISKLVGCHLRRIGTLAFDHRLGACTIVNDEKVYLCFSSGSSNDYKKCRFSYTPDGLYMESTPSVHEHRLTSVAASPCKYN